ncbi:MAG: fluoride efflux transporter CrcB [Zetaproteobacteria bacterium]|nr:MAG: fluoride efflux transporter CrcB [Zetaproteobacteria bacterium]
MSGQLLAVALGGALGAMARFLAASGVQRLAGASPFPWGTLLVNATGSFLLGFLFVWLVERSSSGELVRMAVTVGFLGAFTTFSTFSVESIRLVQSGSFALAAANVIAQVLLCLPLAWLGIQLARTL